MLALAAASELATLPALAPVAVPAIKLGGGRLGSGGRRKSIVQGVERGGSGCFSCCLAPKISVQTRQEQLKPVSAGALSGAARFKWCGHSEERALHGACTREEGGDKNRESYRNSVVQWHRWRFPPPMSRDGRGNEKDSLCVASCIPPHARRFLRLAAIGRRSVGVRLRAPSLNRMRVSRQGCRVRTDTFVSRPSCRHLICLFSFRADFDYSGFQPGSGFFNVVNASIQDNYNGYSMFYLLPTPRLISHAVAI